VYAVFRVAAEKGLYIPADDYRTSSRPRLRKPEYQSPVIEMGELMGIGADGVKNEGNSAQLFEVEPSKEVLW